MPSPRAWLIVSARRFQKVGGRARITRSCGLTTRCTAGFLARGRRAAAPDRHHRRHQAITVKAFERRHLFGSPLPVDGWPNPTSGEWAADRFWQGRCTAGRKSRLSFPMIGRLAELLLRLNPMAGEALRLTYSHLFMDEFQDTTQVQYDLVKHHLPRLRRGDHGCR